MNKPGSNPGEDIVLALDCASTEFYDTKKKRYTLESTGDSLTSEEMVAMWADWAKRYPIVSIEDGMSEDDWDGWKNTDRDHRGQGAIGRR